MAGPGCGGPTLEEEEAIISVDDVYAILSTETEDCFICGALLRRGSIAMQHEAWHRRLEGDDVTSP